jgi:hypothetical protein
MRIIMSNKKYEETVSVVLDVKITFELTFFSLSIDAFSFFSHFLAERCICLLTIRKLTISSSKDTLLPILIYLIIAKAF